jgi:hypothetical protein
MNQTHILGDMAAIYATIAAILLQQAHDDYHSPDAVAIRERAAARAAYENQLAAARRMRAAEMQEQREISNTFRHWDSSKA